MDPLKLIRRVGLGSLVVVMAVLASCASSPSPEVGQTSQQAGTVTVTTDKTSYTTGQQVTMSWTGMPGDAQDWVAISPAGSPANSGWKQWYYTNQVNGSQLFTVSLQPGSYEARAYLQGTYTILGSSTFTVTTTSTGVTVTTDKSLYGAGQPVTVSWTGLPGNPQDWVAISPAGSPANTGWVQWYYTGGQVNGSQVFNGLSAGNFEARVYKQGTYTILASHTFSVTSVTTDKSSYYVNAPVTVSWTNMPTHPQDWVAISPAGSPANSGWAQWFYTGGQSNGSQAFNGLPAGNYEARTYLQGTYTILATKPFTVAGTAPPPPSITTDAMTYAPGAPITATWAGLPGNSNDWIALAPAGAPANSGLITWVFTNGAVSGSHTFNGISTPGNYEARAYKGSSYTILASATFTVSSGGTCTPPATMPVLGNVQSGDLVMSAMQNRVAIALTAPLATSVLFTSTREDEPSPIYGGVMCWLHDATTTPAEPAGITCARARPGTDSSSSTGQITVHYSIATFTSGVTVQRGTANTGFTNPSDVTLTSVDPTQTFVLLNGMLNGGTGWGNNEFVRAQLASGTTLDLRTAVAGTQVSWQVVTMAGASVQRGTTTFATGDTQHTVTINAVPSGSLVLASYATDNSSGIAAGALMLQSSLYNPTTILLKRDLSGSNLDVSWEAVSLPFATYSGLTTMAAGSSSASATVSGANFTSSSSIAMCSSQAILGQSTGSTNYNGTDIDLVGEAAATLATGTNSVSLQRATSQGTAELPWTVIDFAHNCNGQ